VNCEPSNKALLTRPGFATDFAQCLGDAVGDEPGEGAPAGFAWPAGVLWIWTICQDSPARVNRTVETPCRLSSPDVSVQLNRAQAASPLPAVTTSAIASRGGERR